MKCNLCDRFASVHLTEIENGADRTTHLCEPCAASRGVLPTRVGGTPTAPLDRPSRGKMAAEFARKYRSVAAFMRTERRSPNEQEAQVMGWPYPLPQVAAGTRRFDRHLALVEWIAVYIEKHKHLPLPQQILDWADEPTPPTELCGS